MDFITHAIDKGIHFFITFLDWFSSVPGHQWYVVGFIVASLPITAGLVEAYKRLHFKWNATELTNHAIDFTVAVTATLMTVCDFVITNGTNFAHFLPFLATVMPTITAFAPHCYDISKAIHNWLVLRESETQKQRLGAVLNSADKVISAQPTTSFGTVAAGITVDKPSSEPTLIQL